MNSSQVRSHNLAVSSRPQTFAEHAVRWQVPLGIALIAALAYFVYRPALHGGFILDDELLTQSKLIKAPDGLHRFWFTTEPTDYWPVTSSSFWLEWRLWGDNPTGYHVTNLVLHIADSLLIWLLLRRLAIPGAFLAAAIFAVHPVNVESVAWIAQRKNLLAMLFLLISILCYLKTEDRLSWTGEEGSRPSASPWYLLSLMAFVLGMLSKGSVAVLPALLLLIVWWRRPLTKWDVLRSVPFFLLGGLLTLLNVWFQTHGAETIVRNVTPLERLLGAGAVVWFYLFKALVPVNLIFVYPQWNIQASNFLWWLPLLGAVAVTALLVWQCASSSATTNRTLIPTSWARPLLFAWLFFCISLAPVMGFTDVGYMQYSLVADHYQHIAIIGVVALIAAGWSVWRKSMPENARFAADIVAAVYVGGLAFLSLQQCEEYRDPATLYQMTLEKNPACWLACNNLGNLLSAENQKQAAIELYDKSLIIKADQPKVYSNLGATQIEIGQTEQGLASFQQALKLDPNCFDAEYNWGVALRKLGHSDEAIPHLQRAIELQPENPLYYNSLGQAQIETGHAKAAIKSLEMAHELDPDNVNTCAALAVAYEHGGRTAEALATGQQAVELARSQHQTELADRLDQWLKAFRARQAKSGKVLAP
jgi:tetratricopeptide (TPR) repeat protein